MQATVLQTAGEEVGRAWVLVPGQRVTLGRAHEAEVRLRDPDASRAHAALALTPEGLQVMDLGSRNGTFVDERRLEPRVATKLGARATLRIGAHVLEVRVQAGAAAGEGETVTAEAGSLAEHYELREQLGEGATGTVYAAVHRRTGTPVAIKGLHARVASDPEVRERFVREASVRVDHPHVVRVYELLWVGGHGYLVMERVRGGCVRDLLRARTGLPLDVALRLGLETARGLGALHAAGIVHRDIKPANLLLTEDRSVKIGDFGLAKPSDQVQTLTATGQGLGSLAYIAPEQTEDAKRAGPAADLYSLGATLYHLLAGRPPFDTQTIEILVEILTADPPPLRSLRPDCPAPLAELVHALLAKDPDERPPEASLVVEELEALVAG